MKPTEHVSLGNGWELVIDEDKVLLSHCAGEGENPYLGVLGIHVFDEKHTLEQLVNRLRSQGLTSSKPF